MTRTNREMVQIFSFVFFTLSKRPMESFNQGWHAEIDFLFFKNSSFY
jgi:hypothetical protein